MRALILLLLAGCAARQLPLEPPIMVTKLREREEGIERAPDTCIAPASRARIADCSVVRVVTSAEVTATLDAADRAVISRPPRAVAATERTKRSRREERAEERRMLMPMELLPEQEEAVRALTSWVCAHPDDAGATFRLARLHAEHRHFEEAAFFFGRVTDQVSFDDDLGPTAAVRWLESVDVLMGLGRTECINEVEAKIRGLRDRFCDVGLVNRQPERMQACTFIGRINADVDLMKAREGIY